MAHLQGKKGVERGHFYWSTSVNASQRESAPGDFRSLRGPCATALHGFETGPHRLGMTL
jgi:hypothetical protein